MAFVPYMVGGYAVDRMMGGDGTKGALLGAGGSFLPGMLASGAGATAAATTGAATTAAANTMPLLMTNSAALGGSGLGAGLGAGGMSTIGANTPVGLTSAGNFGSVNPLTTGGFSESISPFTQLGSEFGIAGNTGAFGQAISNQTLDSALNPKLFNGALENTPLDLLSQGKDYIDTGYEDMSFMDKVQSGMMVDSAVNQPTPQLNVAPPPVDMRSQIPSSGEPLITQIQGIHTRPPTEEELKYRAGLLR
tara:strand:+ start:178 stop:924 length:747 start_codon:yes stop_codon:yes gene_type:complete